MKIKVLYVGMEYDYGDKARGVSFEHRNFYHSLKSYSKKQNWDFVHYDFMERGLEFGLDLMTQELYELAKKEKPTYLFAVLFDFHRDPRHEVFKHISSLGTITIHWFCDDHWRFEKYSSVVAPHFDFVCTTANSALPKYEILGISNKVIKTQWACNHELYMPYDIEKDLDISFVGQPHGNRVEVLSKLIESGLKLEVFGFGWENRPRISFHQMIRVFSRSKINLNLSNSSTLIGQQIKGRNFEIPGTKSFQLTSIAENLEEYYENGKEIVIFDTVEELLDKAKYYLNNDHERMKIAEYGYKRTLAEHTWHHRFDNIFNHVNGAQRYASKLKEDANQLTPENIENSKPLVSVIIPCYNQAQFLPEAVESVASQTFIDWECIIVNDGSTDNTSDIAQKLIARYADKNIRLLEKSNGGLSDARNFGIKNSCGVYWLPLDADDALAPTFIEKAVKILETHHDVGFVYSHIQHFGLQNNFYYLQDFDADTVIYNDNIVCVCSLVRKSVWEEIGGYNPNMKEGYEDWDFWISCIEKGWKGYRMPEALFKYRKKENTMLSDANRKRERLIADIVLNHPNLYPERRILAAERIKHGENIDNASSSNILIACTHFWPSLGGVETIVENLGNQLVRLGYHVDVATLARSDRYFHLYRGINIISLDANREFNNVPLWVLQLRQLITSGNYKACILLADPLNQIIWSIENAAIPSHTRLLIQPLINKEGFTKWQDNKEFRRRLTSILQKANAVISLSRSGVESEYFREEGIDAIYIPNATTPVSPSIDFRKHYNIPDDAFLFLHVANLWPVKNHIGLLDTLHEMAGDWRLIMIGYPSHDLAYAERVREAVAKDQRVTLIPGLPHDHVSAAMKAANIFLLASHGEVSPVTILEAMSHAKPWLATTECGAVHDHAGGLIASLKDFPNVLNLLIKRPELCNTLGELGLQHWNACYNWKAVSAAWDVLVQTSKISASFNMPLSIAESMGKVRNDIKKSLSSTCLNTPLVSVMVPTYNRPDTLKKALESIALQTYKHIEAIVVNDAGVDVSGIIDAFQGLLTIKYIVHDVNKDRAAVRNTAIKHASGQYIAYLDDDDIFYPDHIETALMVLTNTNHKVIYTDAFRAYHTKVGDSYQVIKKDIPYSTDYIKDIFYTTNITPILCIVHNRDCFDKVGMFDESLTVLEDWDLWIRMAEKYDFYHIKKATCEFSWRVDGTSTTSSKQNEFARVRDLIYKKYYQKFQDALMQTPAVARKPVSIIILTWNALEYTKKCVNSIQNHTRYPHEIVFVDNASNDGTVEYLRNLVKGHSNYKLIENRENKGFAAGNNQGVSAASGEYIMLLNNDVLVSDGWLESLVESLEIDKNIGMVGPITNSISGRQQVIQIPYTDEQEFYKFAQGIRGTYKGRLTPRYRVAGFAVLMRKALYEEAGGLDESFGTGNYEDDDLCLKVREKGYAIMVDESVFIHHYRSQTFIENNIDYGNSLTVNGSKFKEKWRNVDYEQLLELHGSLVDTNTVLCARAKRTLESGNISEAIEIYLKVLQTNPIDEAALCGLGLAYQMDGKTDKTIDAYKKALKVNPSFFDANYNLAIIYANTNQIDDAIIHFNKAIDLNDGDASIHNNLGVLYFKKNMHNDARSCFERALLIDAHYKEAQQNLKKVSKVFEKV